MSRLTMVALLLVGLTACHVAAGVGDNGKRPTHVATTATESAVAQASIGTAE